MKPGDYVEVECVHETLHGILMPTREDLKNYTVIKLSSGYNIGIHKRNLKKVIVSEQSKSKESKAEPVEQNKKLPKITVLHTGGTIASKVDYKSGAVSAKFKPEELLKLFPELKEIANVDSKLVANMLSENMNFSHYNLLGKAIEKELKDNVDGIIITHGTDTLHYTSAALAFMLENISIPVILVGAQKSSDRGSSDAASNIIAAVAFAANSTYKGVAICMHKDDNDKTCLVIDGLHARKMHTSARSAFKSVNRASIAEVNYLSKKINYQKMPKKAKEGKFSLKLYNPKLKIGWLRVHPNFKEDELNFKHCNGLIIEGTGLGHVPIEETDEYTKENKKIFKKLEDYAKHMPVAMTSQTIYGRINMNVYSPGRKLKELGILGQGLDLTPETAFIKLAWLLSNEDKKNIAKEYHKDIRGEISQRSEKDE